MADSIDKMNPIVILLEELEPEEPNQQVPDLQKDPLNQWCASINCAADEYNCNPFASATFFPSPTTPLAVTAGSGSGGSFWLSETDSDSDSDSGRDISCFVTDLLDRCRDDGGDRGSGSVIGGFKVEPEKGGLSVDSRGDGLRVDESDSQSDAEENGVVKLSDFDALNDGEGSVHGEVFDWEEVKERTTNKGENVSTVIDDGEVEEVPPAASEFAVEDEDEDEGTPVWEVLMAINGQAANASLERNNTTADTGAASYLAAQDAYEDYMYAVGPESDALFERFMESENALRGSPPAAKSVVENLPFVELTMEELRGEVAACAVCKDEFLVGEKVQKLPCCHCYHGDCIAPWLGIRNTCPICRFELPTDDPDYERRRSERASLRSPSTNSEAM